MFLSENPMDEAVVAALRESNWQSIRGSALSHATLMGNSCLPEFREVILGVAQRFAQLPAPNTQDELNARISENAKVSSLISSIAHGSTMSNMVPRARQAIYDLAKALAETPVAGTDFSTISNATTVFSIQVQSLCSGS
jgi:hypothetical protein